ncbi:MAG: TAXI family TRAP transporter solute-binding subunit, partial [Lachnospiraceae bacterium]|nr:TAXI family TRAP transporter solute-binding subunit [Lachnospiraceae bacterium]
MRKSAAIMMTVILAVMLFASCSKSGNSELRFGTGGSGGMYYSYAEKLREVSKNSMSFDVRTTAGSSANIRLLDQGFIDIAIVQSDVLLAEGTQACSAIAGLYTEAVQIVTAKGSGIDSVYDLEGKRVSVGEEDSGVLVNSKQIL